MLRKNKVLLIVLTLFILFISIASISAADVDDTQSDVADEIAINDASNVVSDSNTIITDNKVNKEVKTSNNEINTPKTVNVDNTNYSTVFTTSGLSGVNDGDKIVLTESITSGSSVVINKAINLTSENNAVLTLNTGFTTASFTINSAGSFTNVTNFKFYNTQVFVRNATNVTLDNITVEVNGQNIGSGVGVTSIRDYSHNAVVKNSHFSTINNGGSSTLVLAGVDYTTLNNNTITGTGNVGNLIYLTTYNINGVAEDNTNINSYNNITNNVITGPTSSTLAYAIALTGHNNLIKNNVINYAGQAITTQWMYTDPVDMSVGDNSQEYTGNNIINNTINNGGSVKASKANTVANNTITGTLTTGQNSLVNGNVIEGITTVQAGTIFNNNTCYNNVLVTGSNVLINNSRVDGYIQVNSGLTDVSITNNQYTGYIQGGTYLFNNTQVDSIDDYGLNQLSSGNGLGKHKLAAGETIYLTPDNFGSYIQYSDFDGGVYEFISRKCRNNILVFDDTVIDLLNNHPLRNPFINITVRGEGVTKSIKGLFTSPDITDGLKRDREYNIFENLIFEKWFQTSTNDIYFISHRQTSNVTFSNCTFNVRVDELPPTVLTYALIEVTNPKYDIGFSKVIDGCTFKITLPGNTINWGPESSQRVVPIKLGASDQAIFTNNNVTVTQIQHDDEGAYPSDYVLMLENNTIVENNTFNVESETDLGYLYAIDFVSASNCVVKGNNITVKGSKYTNGVYFTGANYANNIIVNNTINLTSGLNGGSYSGGPADINLNSAEDSGYAIVLEDRTYTGGAYSESSSTVKNHTIANNTIYAFGNNVYCIESYGSNNTLIANNIMYAYGMTPKAIGFIGSYINVTGNTIVVEGTEVSGTTADYIPALTSGVLLARASTASVTDNEINVTIGPGIILGSFNNSEVNGNIINSTNDYAVTLEYANSNIITENTLYAKELVADNAVSQDSHSNDNVIENNLPSEEVELIGTQIILMSGGLNNISIGASRTISGYFSEQGKYSGQTATIKIYVDDVENKTLELSEWGTIGFVFVGETPGDHIINFVFEGNSTHSPTNTSKVITVMEPPKDYSLKVDTTEFTSGEAATIIASIYYGNEYTEELATNISKGKVSFKVNGKTLKDTSGKVIYAKVVNGVATIENYEIPESWKEGSTIQAVYAGSTDVEKLTSDKTEITITATEPTITTEDVTATVGATVTLKATINADATINTGKVVFKINGKTVKDESGKVIYAKVSNNEVTVEYTLPENYEAGTYDITAVFISPDYERLEDTKSLTIN